MSEISSAQNKSQLNYLKAIAAIFVVVGHCLTYLENYTTNIPFCGKMIGVLVSSVHVPLFFLIAGYLCHKQPFRNYIRKKIIRLIVPYITFTVLKIAFSLFISADHVHGDTVTEVLYDAFVIGGSYWFVYCMFFIYLLAPIIWRKSKEKLKTYNTRVIMIVIAMVIFNIASIDLGIFSFPEALKLGSFTASTPFTQIERIIMYFPYFAIGMLIRENEVSFNQFVVKIKAWCIFPLMVIAGILGTCVVLDFFNKGYIVKMVIAFSLMLLLFYATRYIPNNIKPCEVIGRDSLHIMFFDSFYRVMLYWIIAKITSPNLLIAMIIAMLTVCLSVISSEVIRKIPGVRVIFGLQSAKGTK